MKAKLLLVLVGTALLCSFPVVASETEYYKIKIAGYDICFPDDWVEQPDSVSLEGEDTEKYAATKIQNSTSGLISISATVVKSGQVDANTISTVGEQMETDYLSGVMDPFEVVSVEPYMLVNTTGLMIKFNGKIDDLDFVGRDLVFASENEHRYIRFMFVESPEESSQLELDYWKILDSIKEHPVIEPPFDDLNIYFSESMRNDVTGTWRIATTSTPHPVRDYIEYYYKTYVKPDDMVHVIVNFTLKTTTLIRGINAYTPYFEIATYEYTDGDEHDAKQCPGGMSYGSEIVFTDTWEVKDWGEYWDAIEGSESEDW